MLAAAVAAMLLFAAAWQPATGTLAEPTVAVRLGVRPPWVISCAGPWTLEGQSMPPGTRQVVPTGGGVQVRDEAGSFSDTRPQVHVTTLGAPLCLNGHRYRGSLVLWPGAVMNHVNLQEYLYSVVAREIGGRAEPEAMKAQAVVARTYALAHMRHGALGDGTMSQVYGGVEAETASARQAVDTTHGQVLAFEGTLARAVCYHSTCGGHTENNEFVFMTRPVPYLRGVACTLAPRAATTGPTFPPRRPAARARAAAHGLQPLPAIALANFEDMPSRPGGAPDGPPTPTSTPLPPLPTPHMEPVEGDEPMTPVPMLPASASPSSQTAPASPSSQPASPSSPPAPASPSPQAAPPCLPAGPAACAASHRFRWTIAWPPGLLSDARIVERTPEGRVLRLEVGGHTFAGDEIRRALPFTGPNGRISNLYSTAFELERSGDSLVAHGAGWGHGVGLCQWGARGMAKAGATYEQILTHYFRGTQVATL